MRGVLEAFSDRYPGIRLAVSAEAVPSAARPPGSSTKPSPPALIPLLHLAATFGLGPGTAVRYASSARQLLPAAAEQQNLAGFPARAEHSGGGSTALTESAVNQVISNSCFSVKRPGRCWSAWCQ